MLNQSLIHLFPASVKNVHDLLWKLYEEMIGF